LGSGEKLEPGQGKKQCVVSLGDGQLCRPHEV
jgi:hypothetical protein